MADLPLDPIDYPGTEEWTENQRVQHRRRELARWHQYEDDQRKSYLRNV